jgi:hypothetical protein
MYTVFWAKDQGKHQNFDPSLLLKTLTDFHGNEAKFFVCFYIPKWPTQKNSQFYGLVLGSVELINAKGIDVAQPIWS